jgi:hypothetical protein
MRARALVWVSAGVAGGAVAGQWILSCWLAWVSGVSDAPAPSLRFDWRWVPLWLLPVEVLLVGLLVSVASWHSGRGFRTSWRWTLALSAASVFVFFLLYGATDQRVVRGVPPGVEDWTVDLARRLF